MRTSSRGMACVGALMLGLVAVLLAGAPAQAVTNGAPVASPSSVVPWVLSLEYAPHATDQPSSICTATAINPEEIVTASHCVKGSGYFYVRVGANSLSGGTLVPIEAIRDNAAYSPRTFAYDIAVVRPAVPLTLSRYAHLASATLETQIRGSRPPALTLYGWGLDQRGRVTGRLNAATLRPQIPQARAVYGSSFNPRLTIAAGYYHSSTGTYSGACNGDSGGPLVTRRGSVAYLVGVVSYGKSGCLAQAPTVFTSVGNFTSWLLVAGRVLPRLAATSNRALPVVLTSPVITGTPALGATLSCSQGVWSANATSFTYTWFRAGAPRTAVTSGPSFLVSAADAGQRLVCRVTARSTRGSAVDDASVTVPSAPDAYVAPRLVAISGLSSPPAVGETATCSVPAFAAPGVSTTFAWFASTSPADPTGATALPLSEPASLVVTQDVVDAARGRFLLCMVTSTNAMGTAVGTASVPVT